MPPQLRQRTSRVRPQTYALGSDPHANSSLDLMSHQSPPVYTIDLSLPPSERFRQLAKDIKPVVNDLPQLFDNLVGEMGLPVWPVRLLARIFLRRLHSAEQTEELRGISKASALPMYLLVAFNVLLDLLMGCTSGGVLVKDHSKLQMMHFRALDWGMPLLRKIIVQLDFIERPGEKVIATTVGYAGYVGVLTGVKKDLSLSLNFRPYHNARRWSWANVQFYWHVVLVLLGFRPSVSAVLRDFLLPRTPEDQNTIAEQAVHNAAAQLPLYKPNDITATIPSTPTTAAYLTFCMGTDTTILEKDLETANILNSSTFISTTNHDIAYESAEDTHSAHVSHAQAKTYHFGIGMQDLIDESTERKACLTSRWEGWVQAQQRKAGTRKSVTVSVGLETLKEWMLEYPVCNEETHFVCIMDPVEGVLRWVRCFEEGEICPDIENTPYADAGP